MRSSITVPIDKQVIDTLIKHVSSGFTESAPILTCSHLTVNRTVIAVLERAEASCLPASSSGCIHPARFLHRAAQFLFLQLQTCQVKGQSPLHRAQVAQQPQSHALWMGKIKQMFRTRFCFCFFTLLICLSVFCSLLHNALLFASPGAVGVSDDAGKSETGKHLWLRWDLKLHSLNCHPDPGTADCPQERNCLGFFYYIGGKSTQFL